MVLETFAAIGLAGNIVQFVHFTSTLLSETRELYRSTSGTSKKHRDLKTIADSLSQLSKKIKDDSTDDTGLSNLAEQCCQVAKDLLDTISLLRKPLRQDPNK